MPLGRRRDELIDAEDDADDIEIAAEEAEETALEADEAAGRCADRQMPADCRIHARERLAEMRERKLFTSDSRSTSSCSCARPASSRSAW